MLIWTRALIRTVSEMELFECTTANLLIRKRYYVYVLFLTPVYFVQVTQLVQFIINVRKFHRQHQCTLQLLWRHDVLFVWVRLDDRMTGQNYLDFLQIELPKQRMFLWLRGLLCASSMTEPLLIIPDMWCNISMTLSLIGGSVVAVPLTGHQDLQT